MLNFFSISHFTNLLTTQQRPTSQNIEQLIQEPNKFLEVFDESSCLRSQFQGDKILSILCDFNKQDIPNLRLDKMISLLVLNSRGNLNDRERILFPQLIDRFSRLILTDSTFAHKYRLEIKSIISFLRVYDKKLFYNYHYDLKICNNQTPKTFNCNSLLLFDLAEWIPIKLGPRWFNGMLKFDLDESTVKLLWRIARKGTHVLQNIEITSFDSFWFILREHQLTPIMEALEKKMDANIFNEILVQLNGEEFVNFFNRNHGSWLKLSFNQHNQHIRMIINDYGYFEIDKERIFQVYDNYPFRYFDKSGFYRRVLCKVHELEVHKYFFSSYNAYKGIFGFSEKYFNIKTVFIKEHCQCYPCQYSPNIYDFGVWDYKIKKWYPNAKEQYTTNK